MQVRRHRLDKPNHNQAGTVSLRADRLKRVELYQDDEAGIGPVLTFRGLPNEEPVVTREKSPSSVWQTFQHASADEFSLPVIAEVEPLDMDLFEKHLTARGSPIPAIMRHTSSP